MHLSGLSPFGPIFAKELRTASRRRRNYLLRVLYLGGLLLFLLLAWSVTQQTWAPSSVSARQQQQEQLGWAFFMFFSMFSVIAMGLIGAVLTSTAINGERLHKTLHVLLITPLSAWQIVSGKLFSRLLTALTLIGLSLPVLALVRLLGGVELSQMFGVIALAIVAAMSSASIGLLLSILIKRAYAVILMAYLLMGLLYMFVPVMILMFAASSGARGSMAWVQLITVFNPYWCAGFLASGQMRIMAAEWVPCVLIHVGLTGVLLVLSAILLRRVARREGEGAARIQPAIAIEGALPVVPVSEATPLPRPVRGARTVADNPILWRELRRPLMSSKWQRVAGTLACIVLLVITYIALALENDLDDNDTQVGYAIVFHGVIMLLACVISATAIAQEKEGDTWTVLLASPLSGSTIVWGKALGALRRLLWPVIGIAAHFSVFVVAGIITPTSMMMALTVIVLFNVIWIASGVALSLSCRRVTVAVILNLALPVLLYGVVSILLAVVDEWFRFPSDLVELVTWYLPFYYLGVGMDQGQWSGRPLLPGMGASQRVSQEFFWAVTTGVGLLHLAVAGAVLAATARAFNQVVGRAPQTDPDLMVSIPRGGQPGGFPVVR